MSIVTNSDYTRRMNVQTVHACVDQANSLLRLGPFCYAFFAYDDWGVRIISELTQSLPTETTCCAADRNIHICRLSNPNDPIAFRNFNLPGHLQQAKWFCQTNAINTIWVSPGMPDVIWTAAVDDRLGSLCYHLPWNAMIEDIVDYNGLMIHGGLAIQDNRALLFVAPPGGGKSTTLATAPKKWRVLSDDAALVWPGRSQGWMASPLPSWTNLISSQHQTQPATSFSCQLVGTILLRKADTVKLWRVNPVQAAPPLFRACSDYPMLVMADVDCRRHAFKLAAHLAASARH